MGFGQQNAKTQAPKTKAKSKTWTFKTKTKTSTFESRDVSRPRLKSRELHHWYAGFDIKATYNH